MPAGKIDPRELKKVESFLRTHGYTHRAVARGELITIVTEADAWPMARVRRLARDHWQLEMATHTKRWEPTPFIDGLDGVLDLLGTAFPWTLQME
jgi:hypothetical protein